MVDNLVKIVEYISPRYTGTYEEYHGRDLYQRIDPKDTKRVEKWIKENTLVKISGKSSDEYLFFDRDAVGVISTKMIRQNKSRPHQGENFDYNIRVKIKISPPGKYIPLDLRDILKEEKIVPFSKTL